MQWQRRILAGIRFPVQWQLQVSMRLLRGGGGGGGVYNLPIALFIYHNYIDRERFVVTKLCNLPIALFIYHNYTDRERLVVTKLYSCLD